MSFKEDLISVDYSKKCLIFLADRVMDNGYRGMQLSQHNRYDVDTVITLIDELHRLVGMNKMTIRNQDLSARPTNTSAERLYAEYTNNVYNVLGRCTQDSIRKNLFVDLHRMGLLNRYDKNGTCINPYEKRAVRYVSVTRLGKELLDNKNNTFQKNYIYTKAIDILTQGLAQTLLDITINNDSNSISLDEFMFFASFIGRTLNGHFYTASEITEFISEFRSMSKFQRKDVANIIQNYCNPNNFAGNKTNKRDFHNWQNEAQQIFMLMDQTVLFEKDPKDDTILIIKQSKDSLFDNNDKLLRSKKAKADYFIKHNVTKQIGFELHHIIPLLFAKNKVEFDALDVWENLIYIDGFTHSKISQTGNHNIKLSFDNENVILSDTARLLPDIQCVKDNNVKYNSCNQEIMQNFNNNTLVSM